MDTVMEDTITTANMDMEDMDTGMEDTVTVMITEDTDTVMEGHHVTVSPHDVLRLSLTSLY